MKNISLLISMTKSNDWSWQNFGGAGNSAGYAAEVFWDWLWE